MEDKWLQTFAAMTQLTQVICFETDKRLPKNQELIMNTQVALPLCGENAIVARTYLVDERVFASTPIKQNSFITAFPGDVIVCETKTHPVTRVSNRFQALSVTAKDVDVPWVQLNTTTRISSHSTLKMDSLYAGHLVRHNANDANCVGRIFQSGAQFFLFATQDIAQDQEIVCNFQPVNYLSLCFECFDRTKPTKVCGKCRFAAYCSKHCQKINWPQHKYMCC